MTSRSPTRVLEREPAFGRALERVAAVPAWVWLTALVIVSFAIRVVLSRHLPAPWIFPDEVTYAELGRSFADSGSFEVRGVPVSGFSRVYPILISPAYAAFDDQTQAYAAVKGINALLMSLVAVPVYLLARRLVRPALALLAAALSIAIPSMYHSALVMTEAAFYPVFALCALALVLALERPTVTRQLAVAALLVLAYFTRAQAILLVPATLTATALLALAESRREAPGSRLRGFARQLWTFRIIWLTVVAAGVAVVAIQLARGLQVREVLGAYESVASSDYSVGEIARWFFYNLIDVDLAFGVVPLAALALVAVSAFRRGALRHERAFSAGAVGLLFWFLLVVAMFESTISPRLEERLLFHVAPLLFVALVAWVDGWRLDDWRVRAAAALVVCTLPLAFPFGQLLPWSKVSDSIGLWPLNHLLETGFSVAEILLVVAFGVLACGLGFVLLRGRWRLAVPALLLVYFAVASAHVDSRMRSESIGAMRAGVGLDRNWIDQAVGDASAISIWSPKAAQVERQNEFFNRALGRSYFVASRKEGLPNEPLTAAADGALLDAAGRPLVAEYAVAGPAFVLAGQRVVVDPVHGTTVYRVDGPLRLDERIGGIYTDRYSGRTLAYTRYGCNGGELEVALTQNALLIRVPQTVVARVDEREVARTVVQPTAIDQPLTVPLDPDGAGRCAVQFTVSPTAVPDDVLGNGDQRRLGVEFSRLDYRPPGS